MTPSVLHFPTAHLGRVARLYDTLDSTNDAAAALGSDPAGAGLAVVARRQTAGRGQYGRAWEGGAASSLLLSLVLQPPAHLRRPVMLTALAAVGVGDAVAELTGQAPRIKWPNDLLVNGRKVCGILIEQAAAVVVGVGLNLTQTADDFRRAALPEATSLALVAPEVASWDLESVLGVVLRCLDRRYGQLLGGDADAVEEAWRERSRLVGRRVLLETAGGVTATGHLRSQSFAALELDTGEVVPRVFAPEVVRGLRAADGGASG